MTTPRGAFCFVLHSHLPYCRLAGMWPHGEEWLHEAASETYLPLLLALEDLEAEGVDYRLTIGITPVLMEQLADPLVQEHLVEYLTDRLARAEADLRTASERDQQERQVGAAFYVDFYARMLDAFEERYQRQLLPAFARLQNAGYLDIATSAATHGYLPLMGRDSTIAAQIATGVATYEQHMGRRPRSIWLPECAYRPSRDGRPGIEVFLAEQGIQVFFSETHLVEGGKPIGKAKGEVIGPYGEIARRYQVPLGAESPNHGTTFLPYGAGRPDVAVLARNNRTGLQVWSAEHGYPGDFVYREFHKKDGVSGLQYWRITGAGTDLADKRWYNPEAAFQRAEEHARHFAALVDIQLQEYRAVDGQPGIVAAAYDTELFGHWWFEGVAWIQEVLRALAANPAVELTTAADWIERHPPTTVLELPAGSWGDGGSDFTWSNPDTEWMWPEIHRVERTMEELAARYPQAAALERRVIRQAAREALLLQSSDWPFLVTTGQAREYATERFQDHLGRFDRLVQMARAGDGVDVAWLESVEHLDNVFQDVDPAAFASRQS